MPSQNADIIVDWLSIPFPWLQYFVPMSALNVRVFKLKKNCHCGISPLIMSNILS